MGASRNLVELAQHNRPDRPSITRGAPPLVQTISINVPYWLPVLTVGMIVGGLWIPWSTRFSLRTLLIATAIVAVLLGLAVAMR
jgi:hypothetical protein